MKSLICLFGLVGLTASAALADVDYNTDGSMLTCGTASDCSSTGTSVTIGGLTLTYNPGSDMNVGTPSYINLGTIISTGTGNQVAITGVQLTIDITSIPGGSGTLPVGTVSGLLSTNGSTASIDFSPSNTTTGFGTLPGVVIGGYTYQVTNPSLALVAPESGIPGQLGQTSIQGAVTGPVPEPVSVLPMLGMSLGVIFLWRRRATR